MISYHPLGNKIIIDVPVNELSPNDQRGLLSALLNSTGLWQALCDRFTAHDVNKAHTDHFASGF